MNQIDVVARLIRKSKKVVILTGDDFRAHHAISEIRKLGKLDKVITPRDMTKNEEEPIKCDLLIVIGTLTGEMARISMIAKGSGAILVVVSQVPTLYDRYVDIIIYGGIDDTMDKVVTLAKYM